MEDSDGVYVPPSTQNECRIYFPVDNCDFQSSLPDEKHEFHGTVQIVYQNSTNPPESKSLKIERNQNKTVDLNQFPAKEIIPKPLPPKHNYQEIENNSSSIEHYSHIDMLWFTMKCIENTSIDNHQTWTGFNSIQWLLKHTQSQTLIITSLRSTTNGF